MAKYELTEEHRAQLAPWEQRWRKNVLNTEQMDDGDREATHAAVIGLYRAANLPPPDRIVFCSSPISGAIAASIASGVWWLREHPEKHVELFGRVLTEADLATGLQRAVAFAVSRGLHVLLHLKPLPREAPAVKQAPGISAATSAATEDATEDATRAATEDATRAATGAATRAATRAATEDATSAATWDATRDATRAATGDATWDATGAATEDATRAATRAATWDATRAATRDATRAATRAATWDATRAATEDATWAATGDATRDATGDATEAATRAATWDATEDADPLSMFLVRCTDYWSRFYDGGNMWSAWVGFVSFFRHVAGLKLSIYEKWEPYENAAIHSGPRFMHQRFCIVSDRPRTIGRDDRNRPHCADGPFLAWRDGWELYAWHGVRVPRDVVMEPEKITTTRIDAEENAEVRRVMIERIGAETYLLDGGSKLLHSDDFGELYRKELPNDEPIVMVRVVNSTAEPDGTFKKYMLRVHPELRPLLGDGSVGEPQAPTARNAVASTFGMRGEEYAPLQQS